MKSLKVAITTLLFSVAAMATAQGQTITLSLEESGADEIVTNYWDNSTAPHSNELTGAEKINHKMDLSNTTQVDFYIYKADPAKATGQAVTIVPGGGYRKLSMKYDGFMIGQYLRTIGITSIVVKYRMPNFHREVPLEDAQAGMRYLRTEGQKWGVDPAQVGILGSSAGGHLAAHVSTFTPDEEKPAFAILIYPVISGITRSSHHGTFGNLLGRDRTDAEQTYYSLENRVTTTTPPTLMLLADDDLVVPSISSTRYYKALRAHGVPAAMHIFPSGGHGWAGHDEYRYAEPAKAAIKDWLEIQHANYNAKKR